MTKQEKIEEVYEGFKGRVDENGWANFMAVEFFGHDNLNSKIKGEKLIYRPKSLSGIESNNGWVKIECEDDLPKEVGHYWTIDKFMKTNPTQDFYDPKLICFKNSRWYDRISHYQIIEKPKLPIY